MVHPNCCPVFVSGLSGHGVGGVITQYGLPLRAQRVGCTAVHTGIKRRRENQVILLCNKCTSNKPHALIISKREHNYD